MIIIQVSDFTQFKYGESAQWAQDIVATSIFRWVFIAM